MVDLPLPSPTVLLAKLRLWLSRDFIGVNPSCCVATRATDVPERVLFTCERLGSGSSMQWDGEPYGVSQKFSQYKRQLVLFVSKGMHAGFKCSLSGKWQLQVSHKCNTACLFWPEDGSGGFPRNFGTHVRRYIIKGSTAGSSVFCRNVSQFLRLSCKL